MLTAMGQALHANEAESAGGSQLWRANLATCPTGNLEFDYDDYAPSECQSIASVTCSHCISTLLQQAQPMSFEAIKIHTEIYSLPRVAPLAWDYAPTIVSLILV